MARTALSQKRVKFYGAGETPDFAGKNPAKSGDEFSKEFL
jgi:hypothetical protein